MKTQQAAAPQADEQLTADERAALDAQRTAPEPEAPVQDAPETPQEGAGAPEEPEGGEPPPEDGKRPQMVPHAALHQERTRRQETERELAELRRRSEARFEELLKLVPQPGAAAPAEKPIPAIPDVQADPVGHIVGTMQQLGATQQEIQQAVAQQREQQQQMQVVAAVQQRAAAMEADYKAANPEYDSAMTFLKSFRDRQLHAAGMIDPAQRAQQIQNEAFQIAIGALQRGGNPAEMLHRLAEASGWSTGWQPPAAQAPNGQAPLAQAAGAPDEAARLRMVQQGQQQSRGLGGVRGNGPAPMTAQKLLDMDDDAFLETMKNSKDARRLMGA